LGPGRKLREYRSKKGSSVGLHEGELRAHIDYELRSLLDVGDYLVLSCTILEVPWVVIQVDLPIVIHREG
jgi:hypothetical protein